MDPVLYSEAHNVQRESTRRLLNEFWDRFTWSDQEDILDFGCGDGDTTEQLLASAIPRYRSITGLDVSPTMINFARSRYGTDPRLRFQQFNFLDADQVEALAAKFDKVFSFFCLNWIPQEKQIVEALFKMTKAGGQAWILFSGPVPFVTIAETLSKREPWSQYMSDLSTFLSSYYHSEEPEKKFADICQASGFQVLECRHIDCTHVYESVTRMNDENMGVSPFLKRIPTQLVDDFVSDNLNEVGKHVVFQNGPNGPVAMNFSVVVAHLCRPH